MVNAGLNCLVNVWLPEFWPQPLPAGLLLDRGCPIKKRRGFPRRSCLVVFAENQRSSCSTLCCDWLASASAETAIDWRVDSAWLLAASWLASASVRLDAPVCNTSIRFLLKL